MKYFIATALLILNFRIGNAQQKTGLLFSDGTASKGYALFAPLLTKTTYLIDRNGNTVHTWRSEWLPAQSVYLLPDGHLLRTGIDSANTNFPRSGGWIEKMDWDGNVVWSYLISDKNQRRHHDICPLPNGNILVLVWENKTRQEAIDAGRNPELTGDVVWTEKILEIKPKGNNSADIVWEWHIWDHLVQDFDQTKKNYGKVVESPELVNINFLAGKERDWLHFNSIVYDEKSDQLLISNRNFSEIFILDHSTTTAEAATHAGGKSKKGGDLLYRWGNPRAYDRGTKEDQRFFSQHSALWIEGTNKEQRDIMVFNNGLKRPESEYSTVDILRPSYNKKGTYNLEKKKAYMPTTLVRQYKHETPTMFYSTNASSAQQLQNGNIFICEGVKGKFFEIDKNNKIIWTYVSPYSEKGELKPGDPVTRNQIFKCIFYEENYSGLKGKL